GPGQPDPVEDRRWRADAGQPIESLYRVHQRAHRADAAATVHAAARVAVETAPRAGAQLTLDVVRQMPLRPFVVAGLAEHAHHVSLPGSGEWGHPQPGPPHGPAARLRGLGLRGVPAPRR